MSRYKLIVLAMFFFGWPPLSDAMLHAADHTEIQSLLEHEIIGSVLPMTEVQRYCHERVPVGQKPASWSEVA